MSLRNFYLFTLVLVFAGAGLAPRAARAIEAYPDLGYGRVDGYSAVGRRSAEFLTIPVSARAVALGDAYTSVANDISAIYYNPAGLAFLSRKEFQFTVVSMPAEVQYNYGAAAIPLGDGKWVVGGFFGALTMDPIEETTILSPNGTGAQVNAYSQVLGGAVAYNFSDRFSAGVVVKHVYESFWGLTAQAVAFDMGTNYHTELFGREFKMGLSVQNLGTNMAFRGARLQTVVFPEDIPQEAEQAVESINRDRRPPREMEYRTNGASLPTIFKVGVSMVVATGESVSWLLGVDMMQPNNIPVTYAVGSELNARFSDTINGALRVGWRIQTDQNEDNLGGSLYGSGISARGLSFGGALERSFGNFDIGFDYAFRNMGYLSTNQFFGLMIGF